MTAGFYGKLPARGDFVRFGLPRDFTDPWDGWVAAAMAGSRARMGETWLPAFLESPVWRFMLPAGLCGGHAALGLMLPSVDRAGRYFPLTFAALFASAAPDDPAWLEQCEAAGRAALEQDASPEQVAAMLGAVESGVAASNAGAAAPVEPGQSLWWTDGAPRVPAARFALSGLPDDAVYATMLDTAMANVAARDAMMPETTGQAADMQATTAAPEGGESWKPPP
jgi:type VI secretion system protein ImpM